MLAEALGRSGIQKFLQLDVDPKTLNIRSYSKKGLAQLLDDVYGPKTKDGTRDSSKRVVDETRDLSTLSKVLGSEKAVAVLRSGRSLEEAEIYVGSREESIDRLHKMTKSLRVLLTKLFKAKKEKDDEVIRLLESFDKFDGAVKNFMEKIQ